MHSAIGLCICVLLIFEETDLIKFRQNSLEKLGMFTCWCSFPKTKQHLSPPKGGLSLLLWVGLGHEGNIKYQSKWF